MGGSIAISLANGLGSTVRAVVISEANLVSGGAFFSRGIASCSEKDYVAFGHHTVITKSLSESNRNWALCLSMSSAKAIHYTSRTIAFHIRF
jgi:hypothetical protein